MDSFWGGANFRFAAGGVTAHALLLSKSILFNSRSISSNWLTNESSWLWCCIKLGEELLWPVVTDPVEKGNFWFIKFPRWEFSISGVAIDHGGATVASAGTRLEGTEALGMEVLPVAFL